MNHILFAGILTTFALAAAPEPSAPPNAPGSHRFGGGICRKLECSEAQKAAVTKIEQAHRAEVAEAKKELQAARAQLAAEFAKPKLDVTKVDKLQAEINGFHADIANARLDSMKDIHAVLTAEQRAKLASKLSRGDHRRGGFQKRGDHPRGDHGGRDKAWRGQQGRGQGNPRGPARVAG